MSRAAALGLAGLWMALPAAAAGQRLTVAPLVSLIEHRVDAGFGIERSLGLGVGAAGTVRLGGRVGVSIRALAASLSGSNGALDRDVGEAGIEARVEMARWLSARAGVTRRSYSTAVARQVWTVVDVGAEARVAFAGDAVHGTAGAALLPVVAVKGLPRPAIAFSGATGLEYRIGAASVGASYALERYDFAPQGSAKRLEQLSAVTVQVAVPLVRSGARRTPGLEPHD